LPIANKLMTASEAVKSFVNSGDCLSIGGFTIDRNPMALSYEVLRQQIKDLHIVMHSGGQALDLLIGAGRVNLLELAYGGNERLAPTCIRFRKAVEQGTLKVEDYTNYQMTLRFMAGAMGVPFLPTYSSLGTDIIERWGFSPEMRSSNPQLPGKKLAVTKDPFSDEASQVVLVPAVNPDVTLIHAQKAAEDGTVRIEGLTFADIEQARASKHVIVSCEELVSPAELRKESWNNSIPHVLIDAVVHQPLGAHPTSCYLHYDYDMEHFLKYKELAGDDDQFENYLKEFVLDVDCHDDYLKLMGPKQLKNIEASPGLGYARRDSNL